MSELPYIPLSEPLLAGNEKRYLDECLTTNFVSSVGPFVDRFEREFAESVGARYAVACSSGTAAIHVALHLLGVGAGDEVMVPTLTFIASANPAAYAGATPLLVDSEPETWNIDGDRVAEELDRRARLGLKQPKAVEVVHLLGHPARLDALVDACARHGVEVIEDAAESLGARYLDGRFAGRHVGTIGRIGCFSFNGNKIMTTGGGGMITTDDERLARRAKHLTTQARLPGLEYQHDEVGFNYRLTNLAAALGVAQLERISEFVKRKQDIAACYDESLGQRRGVRPPPRARWARSTTWLYTVRIDETLFGCDRIELCRRLEMARIQSRPIWTPLHQTTVYRDAPRLGGEVADRIFAEALSLPSSVGLSNEQQTRVIVAVQQS